MFKKVVIAIILIRLIATLGYDLLCQRIVEPLCPDGVGITLRTWQLIDGDPKAFDKRWERSANGKLDKKLIGAYQRVLAVIYKVFGFSFLAGRLLNQFFSISAVFLLYFVCLMFDKRAAGLFLIIGLLLPTQLAYSLTCSKDLIRTFFVALGCFITYKAYKWTHAG